MLYNGACGSTIYIEGNTAGDDMVLITDLGDVPIENVSASKSFNWQNTVGLDNTFKQDATVIKGHTYALLGSKSDIRYLMAVRFVDINNYQADITYAVLSYTIIQKSDVVPGFTWQGGNEQC